MKSTPRALLFAPYFLPRRRVGSMRPFRFALHLEEFGWTPTILTIASPGQEMTPKEERLLAGVEIVEIKPPFDRTALSESQLGARKNRTAPKSARAKRRMGLGRGLLHTLDHQFPTDTWLLLFAAKYREIKEVVRRVQPDVLWCTGDPWSGLVTTKLLAEHFELPWAADFRDPWTMSDLRTEGQWSISRRIDAFLEKSIMRSADTVIFQTKSVEAAYKRHYAEVDFDSAVIPNSFDPLVFDDPIDLDHANPKAVSPGDGLRIGFFGRFRSMSPASVIINALERVRIRDRSASRRIFVHSFGSLNEADAAEARERGVADSFIEEAAVPLEKALSTLRNFDLLLVSTDVRREQIIPAKIFEYLAAGRPILSLSRNTEVKDILAETGTGVQLDPFQPEAVADLLMQCLKAADIDEPLPLPFNPQPENIAKFEARETTRELARVFDAISAN